MLNTKNAFTDCESTQNYKNHKLLPLFLCLSMKSYYFCTKLLDLCKMIQQNFVKIYEESFNRNWDLPALTNYKDSETPFLQDGTREIARLHILFEEIGIEKGDKIALIGKNHTTWSTVFLATFTYGAVIVPILHEFNPESMERIIIHSESKCVFIEDKIWQELNHDKIDLPFFSIPSFTLIKGDDEKIKDHHRSLQQSN